MRQLIKGKWYPNTDEMTVPPATPYFNGQITADGSSGFKAEPNRYHLYVSLACPWASRTLIFRKLKKLEDCISYSVVHPVMRDNGWELREGDGGQLDPINGFQCLHQVYTAANPEYTGRVSVPVLWDKQTNTIVSNESAEIIRMLNSAFVEITDTSPDYYPQALQSEIDKMNEFVLNRINIGVYKCGFAQNQANYDQAFDSLFEALDHLEAHLSQSDYLVDNQITEADWRLFPTLLRFDAVYHGLFKCNKKRIQDYPALSRYLKHLYQTPGIAETVDIEHIKRHYYLSHIPIKHQEIVPKGPLLDFLG